MLVTIMNIYIFIKFNGQTFCNKNAMVIYILVHS
jgi:hypothetical protein